MPLSSGTSASARNKNIAELINANKSKSESDKRPLKQIVAIAYSKQRESKESKGNRESKY
jgi:hypothetical protein